MIPTPPPNGSSNEMTTPPEVDLKAHVPGDVTTPEQYLLVVKCVLGVRILLCSLGVVTNVWNIRAFMRMGLKDSVTIVFFNLAISDLLILLAAWANIMASVCYLLEIDLGVVFEINPSFIRVYTILVGGTFSDVTVLLTAFLAVQRSLCVLMPFHFKGMFTRARTLLIVIVLWVFSITWGVIFLSQYEIRKVFLPETNTTVSTLFLKPALAHLVVLYNVTIAIVLNVTCQVVVLLCVIAMGYTLSKSVKFRQTATMASAAIDTATDQSQSRHLEKDREKEVSDDTSKAIGVSDHSSKAKEMGGQSSKVRSPKEKQATLQVSILSAIFLVTNCPYLLTAFTQLLVPGFGLYERYTYTYSAFFTVRLTFENINSAVNFFVYYKYNTKFRQVCFRRKK